MMYCEFSDSKCCQFSMHDDTVGNGLDCFTRLSVDIRSIWNVQLYVLIRDKLCFSYHFYTCRHSGNKRQITRDDNAGNGETKVIYSYFIWAIMVNSPFSLGIEHIVVGLCYFRYELTSINNKYFQPNSFCFVSFCFGIWPANKSRYYILSSYIE